MTADSFQSEYLLQRLHAEGINTDRQSVDRDKRAYLAWRSGFQEGSIRLYPQAQLLKEMAALIELETKIDHLPTHTKDTADAAAAAYFNAINSDEVRQLGMPTAACHYRSVTSHQPIGRRRYFLLSESAAAAAYESLQRLTASQIPGRLKSNPNRTHFTYP